MIKGRGSVQITQGCGDDAVQRSVPMRTGESVLVPAGVPHGVTNEGTSTLELLVAWGPPQSAKPRQRGAVAPSAAVKV